MSKKDFHALLIIAVTKAYQTLLYDLVKITPFTPHLLDFAIDHQIPFIPYFIYFYDSWYILIFIIPFIIFKKDEECFKKYIISYMISMLLSILFFIFYPTYIIRPTITGNGLSSILVSILYQTDYPALNCLPSVHCIICFLHIFCIYLCKNMKNIWKISLIIIEILIILSTLFIKQHALIDVFAAAIVSIATFLLSSYIIKNKNNLKIFSKISE